MAGASCSLPSSLGVGGVALVVEGPLEALEQVAVAQVLDGGDADPAGLGDFVTGPSFFCLFRRICG